MLSIEELRRMSPEQLRALRRAANTIQRVDRTAGDLKASFAQQRLWFLQQMSTTDDVYHIATAHQLDGDLDVAALRGALDALVARHESLRTCFVAVDGEPCQRIASADAGFSLVEHDLRELSSEDADLALAQMQAQETWMPFDLSQGPLIRGQLLRLQAQRHVLLVTMHHIVSDGWSLAVFVRELEALYEAAINGVDAHLPELPIQYADYAAWQRRRLSGERLSTEVAYWRETLHGSPTLLTLPTDRPRPAEQSYRGALFDVTCDADLTKRLKALSLAHGVSLFMTLLAAWAVVLSRLAGEQEVVIGTPVANRSRNEVKDLIGFFVNTLALRVSIGEQTVSTLLAHVRDVALSAQEHQNLPFEQVVEQLNPPRSLSYSPIFQTAFAWQNLASGELSLPGLRMRSLHAPHTASKFDLTLGLSERDDGISGEIEYATALFDESTVSRYAEYLQRVLRGMVAADADTRVDTLPLIGMSERDRLIATAGQTEAYDEHTSLHGWFERHAQLTPEATAMVCESTRIGYGALNARANRLAHWLCSQGIGPDRLVAICQGRGIGMITSVLATLKSGGAYLPLDLAYPVQRLADMLGDARPDVVLTDTLGRPAIERALAELERTWRPRVVQTDTGDDAWHTQPVKNPTPAETGLQPTHLAYVIYTSGSTGKPKGVMVPHRGVTNLLQAQGDLFDLDSHSRVLQFASFSFDACVFEWVMALGHGATLYSPAQDEVLVGDALEAFVAMHGITHALLPPVVLSAMPTSAALASLRVLISGGEAMSQALAERWCVGRRLFNAYGPTEDSVVSTVYACDASQAAGATVPIGRGLPNHRVYVLDAGMSLLPVGVVGEIYVGGAGVARGYLNRPELTEQRFLDSPFVAGERLYRTGDLGCWRPDGMLSYCGRNDFQVKVRGYRIELGEIEAMLQRCEGVKEAVVIAREVQPGESQLVAYYLTHEQSETVPEFLRSRLHAQLPAYMVPAAFVKLPAWPLTPNAKLDRKALPAPDATATVAGRSHVAPRTPVEEVLAMIWIELLGVERVGIHDNFFDLGGHSLLAMRLIAAIRDTLGIDLPFKMLFESPTIEHMGHALLPDEAEKHGTH